MIYLVTALFCEAAPWIQRYQLKILLSSPFSIYGNDTMRLIISGVGKVKAAAATAYLHALFPQKDQCWINCGIAGHPTHSLGTLICAHKITDRHSEKSFYPSLPKKLSIPTDEIITVDRPETGYTQNRVCEMEASGFYATASHFSTVEKIHCCKIISDNRENPVKLFDKEKVSSMIAERIEEIEQLFLSSSVEVDLTPFTSRWHFTETQKHTLKTLLTQWHACQPDATLEVSSLEKSQDVLHFLRKEIDASPLTY